MSIRKLLPPLASVFVLMFAAGHAPAQRSRAAVSAAEVNGTYRYDYTGRFKGNYNEIKLLALGHGKVKFSMSLVYPFDLGDEISANVGDIEDVADITADTATYFARDEYGECRLSIKFVRPGVIDVKQKGACGFGNHVYADGTYRKVSSARPKFDDKADR